MKRLRRRKVRRVILFYNSECKILVMLNFFSTILILCMPLFSCTNAQPPLKNEVEGSKAGASQDNPYYSRTETTTLNLSDSIWKKVLPENVYRIARLKETERAFTGTYWNYSGIGTYYCAACGNALFRSEGKFASECGWPSFFETLRTNAVRYEEDTTYNMIRTEVLCGRCGGHLGHLFDDGPPPTYKRFCMNSIVLEFDRD